jgi:hypothetical protein
MTLSQNFSTNTECCVTSKKPMQDSMIGNKHSHPREIRLNRLLENESTARTGSNALEVAPNLVALHSHRDRANFGEISLFRTHALAAT